MPYAVVQSVTAKTTQVGSGLVFSASLPGAVTPGNTVIVTAASLFGGPRTGITDNQTGNTYGVRVARDINSNTGRWIATATAENVAASGTFTVNVAVTEQWAAVTMTLIEVSGLTSTGSTDQTGANANGTAATSLTATLDAATSQASELLLAVTSHESATNTTISQDASYTLLAEWEDASGGYTPLNVSHLRATATGTHAHTYTYGASVLAATTLAAFKEGSSTPPQYARPASTAALGTWTDQAGSTTNIHTAIDEATASDTDYIRSQVAPTGASPYETVLSTITDPAVSTGHTLRVRARHDGGAGAVPTLSAELRQGALALSTPAALTPTLTNAFQTFALALSGLQADAITDYSTLHVRLAAAQAAGAMPAWQATGTAAQGTTGTLSPAWPTHQIGDVALLFVETAGGSASPSLTTANGFTQVANSPQSTGTGTAGTKLSVFACRATSTAMAAPVLAGLADHQYAVIVTYRGCDPTTPVHVTSGGVKAAASTSTTVTGVTTTLANCLIVQAVTKDLDNASAFASGQTNAALSTITERFDAGTTQGLGGGIAVWDGGKATAGATGSTVVTVTSSISAFMTIALAPEQSAARVEVSWVELEVPAAPGGSVTVTPAAAGATAASAAPAVQLGSISVAPTATSGTAATVAPSVATGTGPISVTPTAATATAASVAPVVTKGSVSVAPVAAAATASSVAPTVGTGSVTITPTPATAGASTVAPAVGLGSLVLIPTAAAGSSSATVATVTKGAIALAPAAAAATPASVAPAVTQSPLALAPAPATAAPATTTPIAVSGSVTLTPPPAAATPAAAGPNVTAGGNISVAVAAAGAFVSTIGPVVQLGALAVAPAAAHATPATVVPLAVAGSLALAPSPAGATAITGAPVTTHGSLVLPTAPATATPSSVAPEVVHGPLVVLPAPASAWAVTVDPTLVLSSLLLVPDPAVAQGTAAGAAAVIGSGYTPVVGHVALVALASGGVALVSLPDGHVAVATPPYGKVALV